MLLLLIIIIHDNGNYDNTTADGHADPAQSYDTINPKP